MHCKNTRVSRITRVLTLQPMKYNNRLLLHYLRHAGSPCAIRTHPLIYDLSSFNFTGNDMFKELSTPVLKTGFEPAHCEVLPPEDSASTFSPLEHVFTMDTRN